jgi:hypothetical protein
VRARDNGRAVVSTAVLQEATIIRDAQYCWRPTRPPLYVAGDPDFVA